MYDNAPLLALFILCSIVFMAGYLFGYNTTYKTSNEYLIQKGIAGYDQTNGNFVVYDIDSLCKSK